FPHMQKLFAKLGRNSHDILSFYAGSKVHTSLSCIGGIRFDVPRGWQSHCSSVVEQLKQELIDFCKSIEGVSLWKERLTCGAISSNLALDYGLSGPNLRASGINFDLRKNAPYYFYADIEFEVPVGLKGEVLDRFFVR